MMKKMRLSFHPKKGGIQRVSVGTQGRVHFLVRYISMEKKITRSIDTLPLTDKDEDNKVQFNHIYVESNCGDDVKRALEIAEKETNW